MQVSSNHSSAAGLTEVRPRRPAPPGYRPYRWLDRLSGWLIVAVILWGPWSFGCTTPWAITTQNVLGFALGGLFLLKLAIRSRHPRRWRDPDLSRNWMDTGLAIVSVALLLFMLVSAWNARISYQPQLWRFVSLSSIAWLPHSLEQASSWRAFLLYASLAGFFWAVRDWVLHPPLGSTTAAESDSSRLPRRIRFLLWVLCVNGALLAIQGIAQRMSGARELLWLLEPRVNKTPDSMFGPYAYRANASQYFNLVWPVALGLWWTYQRSARRSSDSPPRRHHGNLLLSCVLLMAVCPIVSTSRGGAIVMVGLVIVALAVLGLALWRGSWALKLGLLSFLSAAVGLGILLGWEELGPRMEMLQQGYEQREIMFDTGRRMAADAPWCGTGPGTFDVLFQLYRRSPDEYWPVQMHNDWLELRITFGRLGLGLLLAALGLAAGRWLTAGALPGEKYFVLLTWCALAGCLVHARFDFPFQIPSIVALFLLLCAILSCLSRVRAEEG